MKCLVCDEEVDEGIGETMMYPLEVPYINLFFHLKCYNMVIKNMGQYLNDNKERVMAKLTEVTKKRKKRKIVKLDDGEIQVTDLPDEEGDEED